MPIPRYVSFTEVANALPFSAVHLRRLIAQGEFPQPVKLGERRSAFVEQDVIEWLEHKRAETEARKEKAG
ncbi:MAG TPA: AlpA family phage regulatory protein [Gemmatimonadaceae bacterium]